MNGMMRYTQIALAAGLLALPAQADDIYKGLKGPTPWQLDTRAAHITDEKGMHGTVSTAIFKYWDKHLWAFAGSQYRATTSGSGVNNAVGTVTLGGGPRIAYGHVGALPFVALTLPTTNDGRRAGVRTGVAATYLSPKQHVEVDVSVEHSWTPTQTTTRHEHTYGIIAGGGSKRVRAAAGITAQAGPAGYSIGSRVVGRYTFSPTLHVELLDTVDIHTKGIAKSNRLEFILRYNAGARSK
jgi:hypothetical protein